MSIIKVNINTRSTFIVLFVIVVAGLSGYYELYKYLNLGPCSVHMWRQSDSASFALQYYNKGTGLLDPSILNQQSLEGRAVGEFPIIYYFISKVYLFLGPQDWVFRSFSYLLFVSGVFSLSLILFKKTNDTIISLLLPILLLGSPMLVYYSFGYVPNTAGLGLLFWAWFFSMEYAETYKGRYLFLAMVFWCLAGTIKITMFASFFPIVFIWFWDVTDRGNLRRWFSNHRRDFILLGVIILIVFSWVLFSKWYNIKYESDYFLTTIKPYWNASLSDREYIFKRIEEEWRPVAIHRSYLMFLYVCAGICFFSFKKLGIRIIGYIILLMCLTFVLFILWFRQLIVHDYYIIDYFPLVGAITLCVGYLISKYRLTKILAIPLIVLLMINAAHTRKTLRERYSLDNPDRVYFNQHFYNKEALQGYIKTIGINAQDKVISIPDKSVNNTLYFLNREGWTNLNLGENPDSTGIVSLIRKGAKYLVVNDTTVLRNPSIKAFCSNETGVFEGSIYFYKLPRF